jgi:iron complex transport system substrate-binding protein
MCRGVSSVASFVVRHRTALTTAALAVGVASVAAAWATTAAAGRPPAKAAQHGAAARLPSVASINLCTDQLVLSLADDEQILTVSWLSADPEESLLAARAARFPLNYGTAEELLRFDPDVVVAGAFTSEFTRSLLRRLGYRVVEIAPAESVADIARNVKQVAEAVGQGARGDAVVEALGRRRATLERKAAGRRVGAVVLRPGGFTVGPGTLAHDLLTLAGLDNVAADRGLDRWGSLSVETLVRSAPELLISTGYRLGQPSIANTVFDHPAVEALAAGAASLVIPGAEWACGLPRSLGSVAAMQRSAAPLRARP